MNETFDTICEAQKNWADFNHKSYDLNNRMYEPSDNFFMPLSKETTREIEKGSGDEFGKDGKLGKISSLYSSSALVCNVFEYWRSRDGNIIAQLCGAKHKVNQLHFEKQHPTGLMGTPPNLDVEFLCNSQYALAIESKFTEIYHPKKNTMPFRESYFHKEEIWANLPTCRKLAEDIRDNLMKFIYLDAPQLIKHCLGLMRTYQNRSRFALAYLWYDFPGPELDQHNTELDTFKKIISRDIDFEAIPYSHLFKKLQGIRDIDQKYIAYLQDRYFSKPAVHSF